MMLVGFVIFVRDLEFRVGRKIIVNVSRRSESIYF